MSAWDRNAKSPARKPGDKIDLPAVLGQVLLLSSLDPRQLRRWLSLALMLAMALGVIAALLARIIAVYLSLALSRLCRGPRLELKYAPLLVAGGLRGAVTIALALSLPTELDYWWTIQGIAFGVVLCNLFVQSPINSLLLHYILAKQGSSR